MDNVVDQANSGAQLAKDAGVSIQQIRQGSDQVAAAFEDIALSMGEQSHASDDIARQVEQVAAASQENSEAVHMTREAAAGLEQLSSEIKRWVDQIKVG
jgi:methyl-accepting chemotaxis protein